MCCDQSFWRGMAAGLVVGAGVGMLVCSRRCAMKTCVGRAMRRVGTAMDNAADDLRQAMK